MARSTIKVSVDPDTADIFAGATAEEKDKLSLLWSVLLREYKSCPTPLKKLMDEIGKRARARGLTAEELESILHAAG
jgi:hypothetical protein